MLALSAIYIYNTARPDDVLPLPRFKFSPVKKNPKHVRFNFSPIENPKYIIGVEADGNWKALFRLKISNTLYLDAVKVLDWGHDGQDTAAKHREAFEKEVAVWQKLDHPNVTKVT
jgi:hypothetical protein